MPYIPRPEDTIDTPELNEEQRESVEVGAEPGIEEPTQAELESFGKQVKKTVAESVAVTERTSGEKEQIASLEGSLQEAKPMREHVENSKESNEAIDTPEAKAERVSRAIEIETAEALKKDEELQTLKADTLKWSGDYGTFGGKFDTFAKGVQKAALLGIPVTSLSMLYGGLVGVEGGMLLNPYTVGGVLASGGAVVVGEAMKMYRMYKEKKTKEKYDIRAEGIKASTRDYWNNR